MSQKHIAIKPDTKEMLDSLGRFRETYDDIIKRLIKENSEVD